MDHRAKAIAGLFSDIEGETKQALRRAFEDAVDDDHMLSNVKDVMQRLNQAEKILFTAYRKLNKLWD